MKILLLSFAALLTPLAVNPVLAQRQDVNSFPGVRNTESERDFSTAWNGIRRRGWCGTPDGNDGYWNPRDGFGRPRTDAPDPLAPLKDPAVWRPDEFPVNPIRPTVDPAPKLTPHDPLAPLRNPAVLRPLKETIDPGSQRAKSFTARDENGTVYEVMTVMWISNGQPRSKVINRAIRRGPWTPTVERQTRMTSHGDGRQFRTAPPYPYSDQ